MTSSSTSSSDYWSAWSGRSRAVLYAAAVLVLVEVALRCMEPQLLVPYGNGTLQRVSIRERLRAYGPPEIAILGSSRSKAAWLAPDMRADLETRLGRPVRVENYAVGGGNGLESSYQVQWMLRHDRVPAVVAIEGNPIDLYRPVKPNTVGAVFWTLSDWWKERATHPSVGDFFGAVVRNYVADVLALQRFRDRPLNLMKNLAYGYVTRPSGIYGEYDQDDHVDSAEGRLTDLDYDDLRHHFETSHFIDGRLQWNPARAARVEEMLKSLRAAGSRVILFELPTSSFFESGFPPGSLAEFRRRYAAMAERAGVDWVPAETLRASFEQAHFRDANHVNRSGAEVATKWFLENVLDRRVEETLGGPMGGR